MVEFIKRNLIDVFMIDPLVSFHDVPENDNSAMDKVIKQGFGMVAGRTNSAGELFHHPGKPKPGQSETTVEDGRGASAILWAVRSARVLNFMTRRARPLRSASRRRSAAATSIGVGRWWWRMAPAFGAIEVRAVGREKSSPHAGAKRDRR
jgi:hypothetical protein